MDRQTLFNFLAKDASKPEDRGTVLTMWCVCKKGVRLEWKRPETFSYGSLFDARSDIWNRSDPRWENESFEAETTDRHPDI